MGKCFVSSEVLGRCLWLSLARVTDTRQELWWEILTNWVRNSTKILKSCLGGLLRTAVSRGTRTDDCRGSHGAAALYMQMLVEKTGLSRKNTLTARRILAEDSMHLESAFQSTLKASSKLCLLTWSQERRQHAACPKCFTCKELENDNANDTQDGLYYKYFGDSIFKILSNYTFM